MDDDFLRELHRFQQRVTGLQALLSDTQGRLPEEVEAEDPSGNVRVRLGKDALPRAIRVRSGWQGTLAADSFATAVREASAAALHERTLGWTQAMNSARMSYETRQAGESHEPVVPVDVEDLRAAESPHEGAVVQPRPLSSLVEDLLAAFDTAATWADQRTPAVGIGEFADGKLVLTLAQHGVLTCEADTRWIARASGARLTNTLTTALATARADLAQKLSQSTPGTGLESLFSEAIAILNDPSTSTDS